MLFGATRREVAPDAALAVHSPRLDMIVQGTPTRGMLADIARQGADISDRNTSAYLADMGIGQGVLEAIQATKSAGIRMLTRDEIIGFWIDPRKFIDTPWIFESGTGGAVRKFALEKPDGQGGFRELQWRLSCVAADAYRLEHQRKIEGDRTGFVWISGTEARPLQFEFPPLISVGYETWQLRLPRPSAQALAQLPRLELTEVSLDRAGRRLVHLETLSTDGLPKALAELGAFCSASSRGN